MDADVVVKLADQHAVGDRGVAAVSLMPQVVHVAVDGGEPGRAGDQVDRKAGDGVAQRLPGPTAQSR
ncbi:MAG TPA: hypothetical protein VGD91_05225, partial [Trebonia sp.]